MMAKQERGKLILSKELNDLRWQMDEVTFRCIHAVEYFNGITGIDAKPSDYWRFSQNCFGEAACLLWCHFFNSENNDPVHYRKLFGDEELKKLGAEFTHERVKARLCNAAKISEQQYVEFRTDAINFRNQYVAHREFTINTIKFPRIDIARDMCLELRLVLRDTVDAELKQTPDCPELLGLRNHFSEQSNDWLLKKCRREVEALLCKHDSVIARKLAEN